ncbi:hypothetical protein QL285_070907 [Trifolium repens]|nr:hypothetical protein QL285_070907 [Trifolium repens]
MVKRKKITFSKIKKALHRPGSFTVQPRFLIGVQHAPLRLFIGLFSELFNFELVRVIEEDQEISQRFFVNLSSP